MADLDTTVGRTVLVTGPSTPQRPAACLADMALGRAFADLNGGYVHIGKFASPSGESFDQARENILWKTCGELTGTKPPDPGTLLSATRKAPGSYRRPAARVKRSRGWVCANRRRVRNGIGFLNPSCRKLRGR